MGFNPQLRGVVAAGHKIFFDRRRVVLTRVASFCAWRTMEVR